MDWPYKIEGCSKAENETFTRLTVSSSRRMKGRSPLAETFISVEVLSRAIARGNL